MMRALLALVLVAPLALASAAAPTSGAFGCALGDADGDGSADLLLHRTRRDGTSILVALAGPRYDATLWERAQPTRVALRCAGDVTGDGVADPIVRSVPTPEPAPEPVTAAEAAVRHVALDGATGRALVEVATDEARRGATAGAAAGGVRGASRLMGAGEGLFLHAREETTSLGAVLDEIGRRLTLTRTTATLDLLAPDGRVLARITPQGEEVLAYAATGGAQARVVVVTSVDASPFDETPARMLRTTAYDAAGRVAWALDHGATLATPALIPHAGDLDRDGVADLALLTTTNGGATLTTIDGARGGVLGVVAFPQPPLVLPLSGEALLTAHAQDSGLLLQRIVDGRATWSAHVDAGARIANLRLDAITGHAVGLTDLTGDGDADVALLVEAAGLARLEMRLGLDGALAWSRPVPPGAEVVPVQGDDGVGDLVVVDDDGDETTITDVDGTTGEDEWTVKGPLGDGTTVTPVPDADGGDDLLVTRGRGDGGDGAQADPGAGGRRGAWLLDGGSGGTRWTGPLEEGDDAPPPLEEEPGADATRAGLGLLPAAAKGGLGLAIVALFAIAAAFLWPRRRRG